MPALTRTWRDLKQLHRIFAVSSLLLLATTVWLLVDDHQREWKVYQRQAQDLEYRTTQWRQHEYETETALREQLRLDDELQAARSTAFDPHLLAAFRDRVAADLTSRERPPATDEFDSLCQQLQAAAQAGAGADAAAQRETIAALRQAALQHMEQAIADAKLREARAQTRRKASASAVEVAKAQVNLATRDERPPAELERLETVFADRRQELQQQTLAFQAAQEHRAALEGILRQLTARETECLKKLADSRAELLRLQTAAAARRATYFTFDHGFPLPGKKWLELPILDSFNSPLKIETLWSDGLTQDFNFREVRRFDRCTTCHQRMSQTQPGSATEPAFGSELQLALTLLPLPESLEVLAGAADEEEDDDPEEPPSELALARQVERRLGLRLAEGLLDAQAVTICYVRQRSAAAKAELAPAESGSTRDDVVNDRGLRRTGTPARHGASDGQERPSYDSSFLVGPKRSAQELYRELMSCRSASGGARITPGLLSGDVLLAVNGQPVGTREEVLLALREAADEATQLKAAGRENEIQRLSLTVRRGLPQPYTSHPRLDLFVGSSSPHKVADFACTVCHAGQGSATAFKWAAHSPDSESQRQDWRREFGWFDNRHWDDPMYPRRFLESSCLKCHHNVVELLPSERFPDPPAPQLLRGYQLIQTYGCFGCHEINGFEDGKQIGPDLRAEPNLAAAADGTGGLTPPRSPGGQPAPSATAGTLRRVGPSLRSVGRKLNESFLNDWLGNPQHYRPRTRMPRFFGQWNHLTGASRASSAAYEPLEIHGVVAYLSDRSENAADVPHADGITPSTAAERIARGRALFQTRGCLACHDHADFADAAALRDPQEPVAAMDLSNLGQKLSGEAGRRWLYGRLKQPTDFNPRTLMPDLQLLPIQQKDAQGQVLAVTDPIADLVDYLLQPAKNPEAFATAELGAVDPAKLDELVREHLRDVFPEVAVERYVSQGIPASLQATLRPAERELLVNATPSDGAGTSLPLRQKLRYVGRKTIQKLGCYGCHNIPGFEEAKPIGPPLSSWGRKDPEQLAFEHVLPYLQTPSAAREVPSDFYRRQIQSGSRIGFAYQKLTEPRSYDYRVVDNKRYHERLRMPQFPLSVADREAVMTFVLGLVAKPPADKYVYRPEGPRRAIVEGEPVLRQYQCATCHLLQAERLHLAHPAGMFEEQQRLPNFPFAETHLSEQQLRASAVADRQDLLHTTLSGMPMLNDKGQPWLLDEAGDELTDEEQYDPRRLEMVFQLWQPAAAEGRSYQVGETPLKVAVSRLSQTEPARGGFLAKYLLPHVAAREKSVNRNAKGSQAWGWVPPPLLGEGAKVQPAWLYGYLLDPQPIRPASVLRMPKYNLTAEEAGRLVNYFTAVDRAEAPYVFGARQRSAHLEQAERRYQETLRQLSTPEHALSGSRFDHAIQIVVNKNYCVGCHIVGDFEPQTSDRAKAPNLAEVYKRLRADYVGKWIAKPAAILPYTPMSVNIPYLPGQPRLGGIDQSLYHGTSVEQVEALVDLLTNFDQFAKSGRLIAPLVGEKAAGAGAQGRAEE